MSGKAAPTPARAQAQATQRCVDDMTQLCRRLAVPPMGPADARARAAKLHGMLCKKLAPQLRSAVAALEELDKLEREKTAHEQRREPRLVAETTELIGNLMVCFEAQFGLPTPAETATITAKHQRSARTAPGTPSSATRTTSPRAGGVRTPAHLRPERLERLAKHPVSEPGTPGMVVCRTKTGLVATPPASQCMRPVAASPSPERRRGGGPGDGGGKKRKGAVTSPAKSAGATLPPTPPTDTLPLPLPFPSDIPLQHQYAHALATSPVQPAVLFPDPVGVGVGVGAGGLPLPGSFAASMPMPVGDAYAASLAGAHIPLVLPPPPPHTPLSPSAYLSPGGAADAVSPRRDREFITALLRSLHLDAHAPLFADMSLLAFYRLTPGQLDALGLPPHAVTTLATSIDQIKHIAETQSPAPLSPAALG